MLLKRFFSSFSSIKNPILEKQLLNLQKQDRKLEILRVFNKEISPEFKEKATSKIMSIVISAVSHSPDIPPSKRTAVVLKMWERMKQADISICPLVKEQVFSHLCWAILHSKSTSCNVNKYNNDDDDDDDDAKIIEYFTLSKRIFEELKSEKLKPNVYGDFLRACLKMAVNDLELILDLTSSETLERFHFRIPNDLLVQILKHLLRNGLSHSVFVPKFKQLLQETVENKSELDFTSFTWFLIDEKAFHVAHGFLQVLKELKHSDFEWIHAEIDAAHGKKSIPELKRQIRNSLSPGSSTVFKDEKKELLWSLLIKLNLKDSRLSMGQKSSEINAILRDMLDSGTKISVRAFCLLMDLYNRRGKPEIVLLLFNHATKSHKLEFSKDELSKEGLTVEFVHEGIDQEDQFIVGACLNCNLPYSIDLNPILAITIDALSFSKHTDLLKPLVKRLKKRPKSIDLNVWTSLVEAYARNGMEDEAKLIFMESLEVAKAQSIHINSKHVGTLLALLKRPHGSDLYKTLKSIFPHLV